MKETAKYVFSHPFTRFAISGGLAAVANVIARVLIAQVASFSISIIISYFIGMTTAYILMKVFVFGSNEGNSNGEYGRFALVNIAAAFQVWGVSLTLVKYVFPWVGFNFHDETIGHIIGVLTPVVTSYYLHKNFTFKA